VVWQALSARSRFGDADPCRPRSPPQRPVWLTKLATDSGRSAAIPHDHRAAWRPSVPPHGSAGAMIPETGSA